MADYKELIRRAIQALPENNGASRRAVYEKARAALVGQLRGISPPLAARDITQHRLQLEDCIRQVEQEASEAVIASLKQNEQLAAKAVPATPAAPTPASSNGQAGGRPAGGRGAAPVGKPAVGTHRQAGTAPSGVRVAAVQPAGATTAARASNGSQPAARGQAASYAQAMPAEAHEAPESIEAIIAAAEQAGVPADAANGMADSVVRMPRNGNGASFEDEGDADDASKVIQLPEQSEPPMFKLEARGNGKANGNAAHGEARPLPGIVARAEAAKAARPVVRGTTPPQGRSVAPPRRPADPRGNTSPNAAMSSVREVDVEPHGDGDPQVAIERAIATLEREARNDGEPVNGVDTGATEMPSGAPRRRASDMALRDAPSPGAEALFARNNVETERSGGNAITLFLLLFLALLIAAGGGGFWAWHEGYIDFDSMFGKTPQVASAQTPASPQTPTTAPAPAATAQTNTEPASNTPAQSAEQLSTAPAVSIPTAEAPTSGEPSAQDNGAPKGEERLPSTTAVPAPTVPDLGTAPGASGATPAPAASGNQSLLLEASQDGTTGAVPFSGTVDWSEGKDEMGQPTLIGKANIPARNLGVSVLIRKNTDQTLPASNLMEINFTVSQSFIGGSIAGLPGVLLKNEELVQGTPLVGASARVVGNSFLFALSSSAADEATNNDLLTSRKWMDLAIIYATGKRAIITLEKDDKATALFNTVFADWSKGTPTAAAAPAAAPPAATATDK